MVAENKMELSNSNILYKTQLWRAFSSLAQVSSECLLPISVNFERTFPFHCFRWLVILFLPFLFSKELTIFHSTVKIKEWYWMFFHFNLVYIAVMPLSKIKVRHCELNIPLKCYKHILYENVIMEQTIIWSEVHFISR